MAITQLHPQQATGRRYGSFAGRGHPVGVLTQLRPQRATGGRYGSFAGRGAATRTHPVGRITQLHPQHATGRRYGSFAGRTTGDDFGGALPPFWAFDGFNDSTPAVRHEEGGGGGRKKKHRILFDEQIISPEVLEVGEVKQLAQVTAQKLIEGRREISRIKTQMRLSSKAEALAVMASEIESIEKHLSQVKRESDDLLLITLLM